MIKVGICGIGRWATEEHIPRLREVGGYNLFSMFDSMPSRRAYAQKEYEAKIFSDYSEFLKSGIDLVILTTPSNTHYDLAMEALKRGKNIVIEKPCTLNFSDSSKIFELARRKNLVATVYQNRRFDGDFLTIKKAFNAGLMGKIFTVESRIVGFGSMYDFSTKDFDQRWRYKKVFGGGQLYDMGSHLIDQLLVLFGKKPKSVWCEMRNLIWSEEVDNYFKLVLRFENDIIGVVEISQISRYPLPRWYILGTKGAVFCDYWGAPVKIKKALKETEGGEEVILEPEPSNWPKFYRNLKDVFEKKSDLLIKPEEVLSVAAVIDAAKRSYREKREIKL